MRLRALLVLTALIAFVACGPAKAAFQASGGGNGYSGARSLGAGQAPTTSVSGRDVTVSWTATGGVPLDGYIVKRYSQGGAQQAIGSACTGTVSGLSCTESSVPTGNWRYTVTPSRQNWRGDESPQSAVTAVGSPSLSVTPTNVTSLPQTLSGTIANFSSGQGVTFRLDDQTSGTTLTGSITPTPVPAGGGATVSVTLPASVSNGTHTIYAIGSAGEVASATITVAVPTVIDTSGWDLRDASGGSELNRTDPAAVASDSRTYNSGVFGTSFAANRYLQYEFNSPLRPGLTASSVQFNFRFNPVVTETGACFYVEVRKASDPSTVLGTHGSSGSPIACPSLGATNTYTVSLGEVGTSTLANDLLVRVYGQTGILLSGVYTVDQATVTGTTPDGNFTLYENKQTDSSTGTAATTPWALFAQDTSTFSSGTAFATAYSATRYLKYTFPSYVPSGATINSVTLTHAYRANSTGICTYIELYSGATLLGTYGSSASNLSCSSSSTVDTVDTVPLPQVTTAAQANGLSVRVYAKGTGAARNLVVDQASLRISYTK